jgi:hypothetical protein
MAMMSTVAGVFALTFVIRRGLVPFGVRRLIARFAAVPLVRSRMSAGELMPPLTTLVRSEVWPPVAPVPIATSRFVSRRGRLVVGQGELCNLGLFGGCCDGLVRNRSCCKFLLSLQRRWPKRATKRAPK